MENWVRNSIAEEQERQVRDDARCARRSGDDLLGLKLVGLGVVAAVLLWAHYGPIIRDALFGVSG